MADSILALLERAGPGLHALLTRLTLREDVAEDLMQDLFLKLCNARALEGASNPSAYARRVAINLAFDWRRRQQEGPLLLDEFREPVSHENSPLARLVQAEEVEQVLDAISRLNGLSRQALVLRYIEQNSYEEIACALDRDPHQVRALCAKGLKRVRDLLRHPHSLSRGKEAGDAEDR